MYYQYYYYVIRVSVQVQVKYMNASTVIRKPSLHNSSDFSFKHRRRAKRQHVHPIYYINILFCRYIHTYKCRQVSENESLRRERHFPGAREVFIYFKQKILTHPNLSRSTDSVVREKIDMDVGFSRVPQR